MKKSQVPKPISRLITGVLNRKCRIPDLVLEKRIIDYVLNKHRSSLA